MKIEFTTSLIVLTKCMFVSYLIAYAQAPTTEYENSLLEDYKANGIIKWKWDPDVFCSSATSDDEDQVSNFLDTFLVKIKEQDIMLEQAECTKIRIEVLSCLRFSTATSNISSTKFYINGQNHDIFHTGPPVLSICNDTSTFIIKEEVTGSVLIPRSTTTDLPSNIAEAEKALLEYHKVHGTVKWEWDLEPFCKSQTPIDQNSTPASLRAVYNSETNLMLESVNCTMIEVEILHCDYFITQGGSETWYRRFYLNGLNQRILYAIIPYEKTRCNDRITLIIDHEITGGERLPGAKDRFSLYAASLSSIIQTENLLAKYYEIKGVLKWLWNPSMFWRLQKPVGYNVLRTTTETRDIVLEHANCTKIRMEVFHYLYTVELIPDHPFQSQEHSYATGWNGELFHVNRMRNSRCGNISGDDISGVIGYEIHADGRVNNTRTVKLSGIADIFKIFIDLRRKKVLRKRMWPKD